MGKWHTQNKTSQMSQEVSPFPAGDHKTSLNRRMRKHNEYKAEIT